MKLLLVEDEPFTREGIKSAVDWDALGISRVLTAEDGQKGLEMAKKYFPDIVLADMRMPRMDGSDMARAIKEVLPDCIFIFMSGYSDIIYYKSALHVSALDYVNKPLIIDELVKVLKKAVKQVKENKEKEEHLSILRSNDLAGYIVRENANAEESMNLWASCGMPCSEKYVYQTLILKLIHTDRSDSIVTQINGYTQTLGLRITIGKIRVGYMIHAVVPRNDNSLLNKFSKELLKKNSGDIICLAIGKPVNEPVKLIESYYDAINLSRLSFYCTERKLFIHGEPMPSLVNGYDQAMELNQLLLCSPDKARLLAETQFKKIKEHVGTPIELVKYWGFRMCTELYFQLDRIKKEDILSIPADEAELWNKISSFESLDDLKNFVLQVIDYLDDSQKSETNMPVISEIQRYIYNNYSMPLTLETISEHANLSTTYLCGIFKEATGQTINQYILDIRIHRAKLMLESTNMHINEIANATGYSSSSYFIKAFRKATGITPQEYRNNRKVYESKI